MGVSDTAVEGLRQALALEQKGTEFYKEAAGRTADPLGKQMFESLAEDEAQHMLAIRRQLEALTSGKGWARERHAGDEVADLAAKLLPPSKEAMEQAIATDAADIDALHFALEFEHKSYETYRTATGETTDPAGKEMYEYLAGFELGHFNLLMANYEHLANAGHWLGSGKSDPSRARLQKSRTGEKDRVDEMDVKGILQMAIAREEDAYNLYTKAQDMVSDAPARDVLADLAKDELGHKAKLKAMLKGDVERIVARESYTRYTDLKIAEYLAPAELDENADFQTVLIVAMQKEKDANQFYAGMSKVTTGKTRDLFDFLAGQELIHKNKIEALYDEVVYQEN